MHSNPLVLPAHSLLQTLRRFPLVVITAFITTALCIFCVNREYTDHLYQVIRKLAMVTSLGLPLFFALHCYSEKKQLSAVVSMLRFAAGFVVLASFYVLLHITWEIRTPDVLQFLMWAAALHLYVAFLPFSSIGEINGFWQYNRQLFLRFLLALLYSSVLFLGIAGAIAAVNSIFSLDLSEKIYLDCWYIIAGLFNTIFFCAGVPEPIAALNEEHSYPKGLKIFTQYVLIPLVILYLLILYVYFLKILIGRSTFNDSIIAPVLFFSVAGILTGLLVHPIRNNDENRGIKLYSRFYYFSLIPLIIFYYITLGRTLLVSPVTANRYLGVLLGVWLGLVTLYFIFSRRKNIILIPFSLFFFLFCGSFGISKVSERSQVKYLAALLVKIGDLKNDTLVKHKPGVIIKAAHEDLEEVKSQLEYVYDNYGPAPLNRWLNPECRKQLPDSNTDYGYYQQREIIESCFGLNAYQDTGATMLPAKASANWDIVCNRKKGPKTTGLPVTGYDELFDFDQQSGDEHDKDEPVFLHKNVATFYKDKQVLVTVDVDSFVRHQLHFSADSLYIQGELLYSTNEMTLQIKTEKGDVVKLLFDNIRLHANDGKIEVEEIEGKELFRYNKLE